MVGAVTGLQVDIRAGGLDEVSQALASLTRAGHDLSPLLDDIGFGLAERARRRFQTNVAPDGSAWTPSARAKRDNGKTLVDHGHLRDSITHSVEPFAVAVGTNLKYAAIHQYGGAIKKAARQTTLYFQHQGGVVGNRFVKKSKSNFAQGATVGAHVVTMPARPFLGIGPEDRASIARQVMDYLQEAVTR